MQMETDLRGVHSHGSRDVAGYVRGLLDGTFNPRPNIRIQRESAAFALLDGDRGLGHVVGRQGMEMAIQKARAYGVGVVGTHNNGHYGAGGCYAMMTVEQGMIGIGTQCTDQEGTPDDSWMTGRMNPPFALGLPTREEPPVLLDMGAQITYRMEEMQAILDRGPRVPVSWPLDEEGEINYEHGKSKQMIPAGLLAVLKGRGLAFIMSVLSSLLTGGTAVKAPQEGSNDPNRCGNFLMALDVAHFVPLEQFTRELDQALRAVRGASPGNDADHLYRTPGEVEWRKREAWLREGMPLEEDHLRDLAALGDELGVHVFLR